MCVCVYLHIKIIGISFRWQQQLTSNTVQILGLAPDDFNGLGKTSLILVGFVREKVDVLVPIF